MISEFLYEDGSGSAGLPGSLAAGGRGWRSKVVLVIREESWMI